MKIEEKDAEHKVYDELFERAITLMRNDSIRLIWVSLSTNDSWTLLPP